MKGSAATDAPLQVRGDRPTRSNRDAAPAEPPASAGPLLGTSEHIRSIRRDVASWADFDEPVLITGESGTGKEVVARAIHAASRRRRRPLRVVNCAAFSPAVLMAEIFGHVRGAFTGASHARRGHLRASHGSTLLLDELSEAPAELQAALLRVIENGEVQPLGSDHIEGVDIRILATSNRCREDFARGAALRTDLLHRLAGLVVWIAPLRERIEDIEPLARHFLHRIGAAAGRQPHLTAGALRRLQQYALPGNARELRQVLVRATAGADDDRIDARVVDRAIARSPAAPTPPSYATATEAATLAEVIERHISCALDAHRGNLSAAARQLDVPRTTLQHYLHKYGIERDNQSRSCSA